MKIGRIVLHGCPVSPAKSLKDIKRAMAVWPSPVDWIVMPGGTLSYPWQGEYVVGGFGEDPEGARRAKMRLMRIAADDVLAAAKLVRGKARYLSIGVDMGEPLKGPRVEYVAVVDVEHEVILRWTGKFYPVGSEEKRLVQDPDLSTHFLSVGQDRVLVLGCNDLTVWNPRGRAALVQRGTPGQPSPRFLRQQAMASLVTTFDPTVVLQHPHGTDTPNLWMLGWVGIKREFPEATWASGIGYYDYPAGPARGDLEKTLRATRSEPTVDVVVTPPKPSSKTR